MHGSTKVCRGRLPKCGHLLGVSLAVAARKKLSKLFKSRYLFVKIQIHKRIEK